MLLTAAIKFYAHEIMQLYNVIGVNLSDATYVYDISTDSIFKTTNAN